MLSSRLRSRFFLSLRFAYRRHFHVIIMLPVSRFVCLRVFTFYVSVCICGGIHADVIETVFIVYPNAPGCVCDIYRHAYPYVDDIHRTYMIPYYTQACSMYELYSRNYNIKLTFVAR